MWRTAHAPQALRATKAGIEPARRNQSDLLLLDSPRRQEAAGGHLLNFDLNQSTARAGFL
jgi:hypothetical protein